MHLGSDNKHDISEFGGDGSKTPTLAKLTILPLFDRILGYICEIPAGLLVVAEIVLLFWNVFSRYVLHQPLVWADELASLMFLWMAMLGSAIALRRSTHMRMTAFVDRAKEENRKFLNMFGAVSVAAFLLLVIVPSFEFAYDEQVMTTPTLGISNAWRAAALPTGITLMLFLALVRLAAVANLKLLLQSSALFAVMTAVFILSQPLFMKLGNINLAIFFVGVVGFLVFTGVPIAFSFGLATFGYLSLTTETPLVVLVGRMDEGMSHLTLLAVPLFIFLGAVLEMTGMARAMVQFLAALLGHVKGGLSYVLVGAMYLVSGISGSKAADMAAIAPVLFPEMRKRGVDEGEMLALLAATGAQTETIPPSIVLITIGSVTGISIAALFNGGLLPALVLAILLCLVVWWRNRKIEMRVTERASWGTIGKTLLMAAPALALPFVIRTAVVEGVATATEVSTIGIIYAIAAGLLIYRRLDFVRIWPALVETAVLSGAILIIIGTATGMAWALTQSGFSRQLAVVMTQVPGGAAAFMAVSIVVFLILGSVLEGIPAIVLFGPLLFPIAAKLGINEVHYSMVVVLSMGIGLFAPPFGVGYYAACAISRVHPNAGMRPLVGYIIAMIIGVIIVAAFPGISTAFLK